jgi:exodeoxyribonuclease VII large subunit
MHHMARLPFNTDPPDTGHTQRDHPITVGELAGQIKRALADGLPRKVRVVGEVSNLSDRTHWFFSLKDVGAALRCVCFATNARRVGFEMRDGMQVVVTGRVDFYDAQGSVQLYVDAIDPVGQGALELRLRQMIEELRELSYFDPEHKNSLPAMPTRIAVVTSQNAAALQDVIDTAHRRWPGCRLYLYDVRVQGESAAGEIATALNSLSIHGQRLGIDAIILTRGGGSIEDLWAFNERAVADAVYRCTLPVVAAIGHETDTTVAELVADVRCATPTQAAMTLIPDRETLTHQTHQLGQRLSLALHRHVEHAAHRLTSASRHTLFRNPERLVELGSQRLEQTHKRFETTLPRRLTMETSRVEALTRQLGAVNPSNVLDRGYSYTLGADGKVLRHTQDANPGDRITTVLADGRVGSIVETGTAGQPAPRRPKRKKPPPTDTGPGLFEADETE